MDKRKYYVSVQDNAIVDQQGATPYELEIEATDEELAALQEMFDNRMKLEEETIVRAAFIFTEAQGKKENDLYDYWLISIYRKLEELGTPETKRHIASMGILQEPHPLDSR